MPAASGGGGGGVRLGGGEGLGMGGGDFLGGGGGGKPLGGGGCGLRVAPTGVATRFERGAVEKAAGSRQAGPFGALARRPHLGDGGGERGRGGLGGMLLAFTSLALAPG